jgi:hypothetical protein
MPSGRPVSEALVITQARLAPVGGRAGFALQVPVSTDPQGRFYFARLPAGSYTFVTQKQGFLNSVNQGVAIDLGDGERVTDVKIRLQRFASISGTLRDEAGDPVVAMDVWAFRRAFVNGRPGIQGVGTVKSDDRGAYRLGNLMPGDYFVCACVRDPIPFDGQLLTTLASQPVQLLSVAARALTVGADVVSLDNTLRTYAPTFHPNSSTIARAIRITVGAGDEKTGVDVNVDLVRATRVSGRVVGAESPINAFEIRLIPVADADSGVQLSALQPMLVQPDGRFDFASVPPGQYRLMVTHRETDARGGAPSGAALTFVGPRGIAPPSAPTRGGGPAGSIPVLWANEPVSVGETGVSGLVVTLNRSATVTGRLVYSGTAPQPPAQQFARVNPAMIASSGVMTAVVSAVGSVSPEGALIIPGVLPGKYALNIQPLPGYPTLKSVTVGGLDITDLPIEVADKDLADLVVTFVDTPLATLTVTTPIPAGAQAVEDTVALMFPADRKYWTDYVASRRRFKNIPMSPRGLVNFVELPAGDYFVLLVPSADAADYPDPVKLDQLSRRAQRVTISDGAKQTIEVRR